MNYKKDNQPLV